MTRNDISDELIHFTSGADDDAAFANLISIMYDGAIRGSFGKIKGGFSCVCFTEAPIELLSKGFVNPSNFSRYRPFGISYEKSYVYQQGGRPVIYQSDDEFLLLPEELRWRHMRYEPIIIPPAERPTDFTWEREWRIQCDSFESSPYLSSIVLPNQIWVDRLLKVHDSKQDRVVNEYSQIMDIHLAEQYREIFPWRIITLD